MGSAPKRQNLKLVIGATVILVGVGLVYAWSANRVIELGYEISQLQTARREQLEHYSKLRVELASLRRPERIESIATGKLGLVKPRPEWVVVLN